ncbi:MAG TPA: hypothetical protein VJS30_25750, partial [Paraburkholderia sp.]|nr:hypothetical protein [Paraburkholderia sp.]
MRRDAFQYNPGLTLAASRLARNCLVAAPRLADTPAHHHAAPHHVHPAPMPLPLLALAVAAFGIGTTEFVIMGLLPDVARDLSVSIPAAGMLVSA